MNLKRQSPYLILNESALKLIAVVAMLIDHASAVLIENAILHQFDRELYMQILATEAGAMWRNVDILLRSVGRIAFPIFCFLLVEGFLHTKSVKKYMIRLLTFAVISEIPFDLALFETWFNPQYQNVFFTLAIGLAVLVGLRRFEGQPFFQLLAFAAGAGAACILETDYDAVGITMIAAFYLMRGRRLFYPVCGLIAVFESAACFGAAALALIPIRLCSGERGRQLPKYFFYGFYPAHLFLLALLQYLPAGIATAF